MANNFTMMSIFFSLWTNFLLEGVFQSLKLYQNFGKILHLTDTLEGLFFKMVNNFLMRKENLPKINKK